MSSTSSDSRPDAAAVASAFRLAGDVGPLEEVDGAWSNRLFRLIVGGDAYAIKEMLNPWDQPTWADWLDEAWSFELQGISAGVAAPQPIPNPADDRCIAFVEVEDGSSEVPVRVHHWVDGWPAPLGLASEALAMWSGATMATLHALAVAPIRRGLFPIVSIESARRWPELIEVATGAAAEWAPLMARAAASVRDIATLALEADHPASAEVMTHGDIDQKNIVLTDQGPVLCDWDVASPLVPRREVADVAMSMGVWDDLDRARTVVRAYREAGGDFDAVTPADLGPSMMTGVDWVVLNIERALRLRDVTEAESALGARLVPNLLARLPYEVEVARRVGELVSDAG